MEKVKKALDKIISTVCVIIFIAMVLLTTYQVGVRYIFKSPSSISETLTRYLFVWLIILSATYVFGQRDHICINALKDTFSAGTKKAVNIFGECVVILFAVLIMIYGGSVITKMNMLKYDSILNIPTRSSYSVIPFWGVLIIVYTISSITKYARE